MELSVHHVTAFSYDGPVRDNINEVRLQPRTDALQVCLDFRLTLDPPTEVRSYTDWLGNIVHTFDVGEPHHSLAIVARSRVITNVNQLPERLADLPDEYEPLPLELADRLIDFLQPTQRANFDNSITRFAQQVQRAQTTRSLGALIWDLSHALHEQMEYVPGATDVGSTASDALAAGRGVCQDYTHIFLAAVRGLGIPARYTSGYFHPEGADGEVGEQASHAWPEVWFPRTGWVGIDPTNDRLVNERYVRIAYGRDYSDVSPVKGSYRGAETKDLHVEVTVSTPVAAQQQQ